MAERSRALKYAAHRLGALVPRRAVRQEVVQDFHQIESGVVVQNDLI